MRRLVGNGTGSVDILEVVCSDESDHEFLLI